MVEICYVWCYCGVGVFIVVLIDGLNIVCCCSCFFCWMRGVVVVFVLLIGIIVIKGEDKFMEYCFNIGIVCYFFCLVCGIYIFY